MEYYLFNFLGLNTPMSESRGTKGMRLEDTRGATRHLPTTEKNRWDERNNPSIQRLQPKVCDLIKASKGKTAQVGMPMRMGSNHKAEVKVLKIK